MSKKEVKLSSIANFLDSEIEIKENDVITRKELSEDLIVDEPSRTFEAVISTTDVDADGDVVYSMGCDPTKFLKNPVVLWSHSHSSPPIGKVTSLQINKNNIKATIQIAETEQADEIWSLVKGGYIKCNSIGFVAKKALIKGTKEFNEFITKNLNGISNNIQDCIRIITSFDLYENSLVSIPSNENALIEAVSAKSLKISDKLQKELGIDSTVKIRNMKVEDIKIIGMDNKEINLKENKEMNKPAGDMGEVMPEDMPEEKPEDCKKEKCPTCGQEMPMEDMPEEESKENKETKECDCMMSDCPECMQCPEDATDMPMEDMQDEKPFPNYFAARQNDPDKYVKFRYAKDKGGAGIDFIYGITSDGATELQSIRFDADKFNKEQVVKWLEDHKFKTNIEEPKKEEKEIKFKIVRKGSYIASEEDKSFAIKILKDIKSGKVV